MKIFPLSGGIPCGLCGATCFSDRVPIPPRFCVDFNHVICDPCFDSCEKPECPVRDGSGGVCGSLIADVNLLSFPLYIDHYMRKWNFPCPFDKYGCPYVGNGPDVMEHFATDCGFKRLSICNVTPAGSDVNCKMGFIGSPLQKIWHMRAVHGIQFGREDVHVVDMAMMSGEDDGQLNDTWQANHIQILDYPEDRFCMIFVYENKVEMRMWLCELDPRQVGVKPGTRFEVTVRSRSKDQGGQFYGHRTRVIPCMIQGVLSEGDKYWHRCFIIEKRLLRQIATVMDMEMRFKMRIRFNLREATSSSDSEGGDDVGELMEAEGRNDPVVEDRMDEEPLLPAGDGDDYDDLQVSTSDEETDEMETSHRIDDDSDESYLPVRGDPLYLRSDETTTPPSNEIPGVSGERNDFAHVDELRFPDTFEFELESGSSSSVTSSDNEPAVEVETEEIPEAPLVLPAEEQEPHPAIPDPPDHEESLPVRQNPPRAAQRSSYAEYVREHGEPTSIEEEDLADLDMTSAGSMMESIILRSPFPDVWGIRDRLAARGTSGNRGRTMNQFGPHRHSSIHKKRRPN